MPCPQVVEHKAAVEAAKAAEAESGSDSEADDDAPFEVCVFLCALVWVINECATAKSDSGGW